MVKLRDANYCNLKLLLIYLVIYGHFIENNISNSEFMLAQYRMIYMFHMPLFVFISGLFINSAKDCVRQIKHLLPIYLISQLITIFYGGKLIEPWWILWYLFSFCAWSLMGYFWFKYGCKNMKWIVLVISIFIGCFAGYIPWLNRILSGSRTIVFFPYFFAGLILSPKIQWRKYRKFGIIALIMALGLILCFDSEISVQFLYHAGPFQNQENGFTLCFICYGIASLMGFALLTLIPSKRFVFTKVGANTLPAYLVHAPIVYWMNEIHLSWISCAILSGMFLLFLDRFMQWGGTLYGIVSEERGNRGVGISESI